MREGGGCARNSDFGGKIKFPSIFSMSIYLSLTRLSRKGHVELITWPGKVLDDLSKNNTRYTRQAVQKFSIGFKKMNTGCKSLSGQICPWKVKRVKLFRICTFIRSVFGIPPQSSLWFFSPLSIFPSWPVNTLTWPGNTLTWPGNTLTWPVNTLTWPENTLKWSVITFPSILWPFSFSFTFLYQSVGDLFLP